MHLHYTVTEQAYLDCVTYLAQKSPGIRLMLRKGRIIPSMAWSLIAIGGYVVIFWRFGHAPLSYPVVFVGLGILWYAFYPKTYWNSYRKQLRALLTERGGLELAGAFTLRLLEDRLRQEGESGATEIVYQQIRALVQNNDHLYIDIGSLTAFIIPLKAFEGDNAHKEFVRELEGRIRESRAKV